jgi:glycosyltransferase involved in cell wall biosynthesis
MKILIISTAAIPTPPPDDGYSGLERICAWLTFEFAKRGHDVTLVSAKGSPWEGSHPIMDGDKQIATMNVIGTINPSWDGRMERNHYLEYQKLLEKEFSDGNSIVIDHTWWCYSYLSKQKYPDMNLIHTHHGLLGFTQPPPVLHPRFLGLSTFHADYMNTQLKIPVRHIHNGIPLTQFPEDYDFSKHKGSFLLSLNRITAEKGIKNSIDIAVATKTPIILVGDDTKVGDQQYVNDVIERCRHSNGLAQYMGLVDNKTKNQLLQQCKAVIACPAPNWREAFGLYAVEAMNFYKPVIAVANGGLNDIVINGTNGFIAPNPELLKPFVEKLDDIDPQACRNNVEQRFSTDIMAQNYLNLFQKILDKDESSYW